MKNQLTKSQNFNKTLEINSRLYDFNLNLESETSVLTFNVVDKTDLNNPQNFVNNFSLN